MRKYFFFLAFILVACVNNGDDGSTDTGGGLPAATHVPEITGFALSPDTATYMDGDGTIVVTAEVSVRDTGLDIQTLWVRMPDGTTVELGVSLATETGTFTKDIPMPTNQIGALSVEFWLKDAAGGSSDPVTVPFHVVADVQVNDWTNRVSGLPYALNDVVWDGSFFIAVGNGGLVLTSADGIDWAERESATDANLNAVAACGPDIMAVGDGYVVLLSTEHGDTWVTKVSASGSYSNVLAIACNSTQVVIGGFSYGLAAPFINISEDRGDTWHYVGTWHPAKVAAPADLIYSNGLFITVTTRVDPGLNEPWIVLSPDGWSWNSIPVLDWPVDFYTIIHDGNRFIIAGENSTVLASFDGFNWTELQTPGADVIYLSAAWNGSKLVLAGGSDSPSEPPLGIASIDSGVTWEVFNIDGNYESRGMTFGNGHFVSVGQSAPLSGEGAIYTAE